MKRVAACEKHSGEVPLHQSVSTPGVVRMELEKKGASRLHPLHGSFQCICSVLC